MQFLVIILYCICNTKHDYTKKGNYSSLKPKATARVDHIVVCPKVGANLLSILRESIVSGRLLEKAGLRVTGAQRVRSVFVPFMSLST